MDMDTDTHAKYAYNGKVMLGAAILLFFFVIIIIFLHTYAYSCFRRRRNPQRHRRYSRRLFTTIPTVHHKGLDPSLFDFLPTFTYSSATHRHLQECAVCLSEFEEDDEGRVLPNCNHGFHTHCIDTWFRSHSNCPICRAPVQPPKVSPQTTGACVSDGELPGCSHLPPPIGCPRKGFDLEVLSVVVEVRGEELDETLRSSASGSAGEAGLRSSDEQILILKRV